MDESMGQLIASISQKLKKSTPILEAIGNETRLNIIFSMLELPCEAEGGIRVGDITQKAHLSRPAVSHHIKILKDAGIITMNRVGTKNYYKLDPDNKSLLELQDLIDHIVSFNKINTNN
ncbi:helix-turn-helix transcriptional regulator [uncultured Anaerococcus sp.]|uniref:ArsR/SmtB family transcription factor n=1 Tax=uncultured Anaerococcus sp. TaxID=293428 RepID=UPI00261C12B3|nr:metalloregulator ArsR/SmtB family transcription factor [uncultured Anaerococcus sp.]